LNVVEIGQRHVNNNNDESYFKNLIDNNIYVNIGDEYRKMISPG
jgi:hypothetical protein